MIRSWCWGVRRQGQSNRRSYGSHWERRGKCTGIIVIRIVPIGQYIILLCTRHHHEWSSLHYLPCTKSFVQQTINSINQLYVYGWNISVVNILGGTRTWQRIKQGDWYHHWLTWQSIIFVSSYVPTQSYITSMPCHATIHLPQLIWFDLIQSSSPTPNRPNSSTVIHSRQTTTTHNWWWHRLWHNSYDTTTDYTDDGNN